MAEKNEPAMDNKIDSRETDLKKKKIWESRQHREDEIESYVKDLQKFESEEKENKIQSSGSLHFHEEEDTDETESTSFIAKPSVPEKKRSYSTNSTAEIDSEVLTADEEERRRQLVEAERKKEKPAENTYVNDALNEFLAEETPAQKQAEYVEEHLVEEETEEKKAEKKKGFSSSAYGEWDAAANETENQLESSVSNNSNVDNRRNTTEYENFSVTDSPGGNISSISSEQEKRMAQQMQAAGGVESGFQNAKTGNYDFNEQDLLNNTEYESHPESGTETASGFDYAKVQKLQQAEEATSMGNHVPSGKEVISGPGESFAPGGNKTIQVETVGPAWESIGSSNHEQEKRLAQQMQAARSVESGFQKTETTDFTAQGPVNGAGVESTAGAVTGTGSGFDYAKAQKLQQAEEAAGLGNHSHSGKEVLFGAEGSFATGGAGTVPVETVEPAGENIGSSDHEREKRLAQQMQAARSVASGFQKTETTDFTAQDPLSGTGVENNPAAGTESGFDYAKVQKFQQAEEAAGLGNHSHSGKEVLFGAEGSFATGGAGTVPVETVEPAGENIGSSNHEREKRLAQQMQAAGSVESGFQKAETGTTDFTGQNSLSGTGVENNPAAGTGSGFDYAKVQKLQQAEEAAGLGNHSHSGKEVLFGAEGSFATGGAGTVPVETVEPAGENIGSSNHEREKRLAQQMQAAGSVESGFQKAETGTTDFTGQNSLSGTGVENNPAAGTGSGFDYAKVQKIQQAEEAAGTGSPVSSGKASVSGPEGSFAPGGNKTVQVETVEPAGGSIGSTDLEQEKRMAQQVQAAGSVESGFQKTETTDFTAQGPVNATGVENNPAAGTGTGFDYTKVQKLQQAEEAAGIGNHVLSGKEVVSEPEGSLAPGGNGTVQVETVENSGESFGSTDLEQEKRMAQQMQATGHAESVLNNVGAGKPDFDEQNTPKGTEQENKQTEGSGSGFDYAKVQKLQHAKEASEQKKAASSADNSKGEELLISEISGSDTPSDFDSEKEKKIKQLNEKNLLESASDSQSVEDFSVGIGGNENSENVIPAGKEAGWKETNEQPAVDLDSELQKEKTDEPQTDTKQDFDYKKYIHLQFAKEEVEKIRNRSIESADNGHRSIAASTDTSTDCIKIRVVNEIQTNRNAVIHLDIAALPDINTDLLKEKIMESEDRNQTGIFQTIGTPQQGVQTENADNISYLLVPAAMDGEKNPNAELSGFVLVKEEVHGSKVRRTILPDTYIELEGMQDTVKSAKIYAVESFLPGTVDEFSGMEDLDIVDQYQAIVLQKDEQGRVSASEEAFILHLEPGLNEVYCYRAGTTDQPALLGVSPKLYLLQNGIDPVTTDFYKKKQILVQRQSKQQNAAIDLTEEKKISGSDRKKALSFEEEQKRKKYMSRAAAALAVKHARDRMKIEKGKSQDVFDPTENLKNSLDELREITQKRAISEPGSEIGGDSDLEARAFDEFTDDALYFNEYDEENQFGSEGVGDGSSLSDSIRVRINKEYACFEYQSVHGESGEWYYSYEEALQEEYLATGVIKRKSKFKAEKEAEGKETGLYDPLFEDTFGESEEEYYRRRSGNDEDENKEDENKWNSRKNNKYNERENKEWNKEDISDYIIVLGAGKRVLLSGGRYLYRNIAQGDQTKRELDNALMLATGITADAKIIADRVWVISQREKVASHLNSIFSELGMAELKTVPRSRKDIEKVQKQINQYLKEKGYAPISGNGKKTIRDLKKLLKDKSLPADYRKAVEAMLLVKKNQFLLRKRHSRLLSMIGRRMRRELRQSEVGYGLGFTMTALHMIRRSVSVGIKVSKWTLRKAGIDLKKSVKASLLSIIQRLKNAKKKTAGEEKEEGSSFFADHLKTESPFKSKFKTNKTAEKEAKKRFSFDFNKSRKLQNWFGRTAESGTANAAQKAASAVASGVKKAVKSVADFYVKGGGLKMMLLLAAAGVALALFVVVFMFFILTSYTSYTDLSSADPHKVKVILEEVKKCYEEQIESIDASAYDHVEEMQFINVRNETAYASNPPSTDFEETTNAAEILCMAFVYFDHDIDSVSDSELKDYARQLYNSSHSLRIKTVSETVGYNEETEESIEIVTATPVLTTYYFDQIFGSRLSGSGSVISASGSTTEFQIWYTLLANGFTPQGAAAIMGNIMQECSFDQNCQTGSYYGLCQWDAGAQERLKSYCSEQGLDYTTVKGQISFLIYDLQNTKNNGFHYEKIYDILQTTEDVQLAAEVFCVGYERCVGGNDAYHYKDIYWPYSAEKDYKYQQLTKRVNYALGFYDEYGSYEYSDGADIIEYGSQFIGNPYVYGGNDLNNGIDCSGFVTQVLINTGHLDSSHYPRIHSTDFKNYGEPVASIEEALPGDVIVWDGHVGFYMGNDQVLHAANSNPYPRGGIKVTTGVNAAGGSHGNYIAIRRFPKLSE